MSFKDYIKEQEELVILNKENDKKEKIADLIRSMEDLNDEKFHDFAVNELGMEESEAEALVYKMLRDFLLAGDKDEDAIPDAIDDEIAIDDEVAADDEVAVDDAGEEEFADVDVEEV